jgi:hypothetical protein
MRRLVTALAAALATAAGTPTVAAAPPTTADFDFTFPVELCPGVTGMEQTLEGTVKIITQNPAKEIQVFPSRTTVSFTANERTLSSPAPASLKITRNADGSIAQTVVNGLSGVFTVPGYGNIMLDTGYIVFAGEFPFAPVIAAKGPHEFFGPDADFDAFCAFFEGTL